MTSSLRDPAWRANVAAIIMNEQGNVLLGSRSGAKKTRWHFPQGGVKRHESPEQAVLREIREEVGLQHCRILAELPGLRYTYREKNKKSKEWRGQQQIYYLLQYTGDSRAVDCTASKEFDAAHWFSPASITPELFVPFKRAVAMRALAHFFTDPDAPHSIRTRCTPRRYLYSPGSAPESPALTSLFAGGKKEALFHTSLLSPINISKKQRVLVLLLGMKSSGAKKALRSLACHLDPLKSLFFAAESRLASASQLLLPRAGEICFLAAGPCTSLADPTATARAIHALEASLPADTTFLKIALHLSRGKQARRLSEKNAPIPSLIEWQAEYSALLSLLDATSAHTPWHLIPADHAWYRDYLIAALVRSEIAH